MKRTKESFEISKKPFSIEVEKYYEEKEISLSIWVHDGESYLYPNRFRIYGLKQFRTLKALINSIDEKDLEL